MSQKLNVIVPGMEVIIPDELRIKTGGVYKFTFDDGRFYVGVSSSLHHRVADHIRNFRRGFVVLASLKCMKGYSGRIVFELIAYSDDPHERIRIERQHTADKASGKVLNKDNSRGLFPDSFIRKERLEWLKAYEATMGIRKDK